MVQLRTAFALGALTALGLLAGCSNEAPVPPAAATPPAATSPAATASADPATTATPTSTATRQLPLPEQSELSRTFTQDGAGAFAAYFTQVLNHARATGDPSLLLSISDSGCLGCQAYGDEIVAYSKRGLQSTGTTLQFKGTQILSWEPDQGDIHMDVLVDRAAHQLLDRRGIVIENVPATTDDAGYMWLRWIDNRWVVWEVS